ncbi:NPXTG-anchored protein [Ruminococcus albus]|uniref:LPXTG-motif cell wall anchor domain-containing protein n=1 Tax=Ruminococcus albus (strain ATCC 27210 / DSM 20455 / JCM 14654 / NCDO 2250 / 7) TaxID=697329 RepID=E6UH11_RUMA7|nr:NPXTG-anchored protein [Ruminococcus albus]ADU22003.1 hypothetical protein Rumal_1502 [Ruminococcus albus 7 = DSM 20455]
MKAKRIFAGFSAAFIAAAMTITVSATKLSDICAPSDTDAAKNDLWYGVGAMGFFMNNDGKWSWNQSEWFGIDAEGKISVEYKISPILADKTISNKGSLGEMGVMICNLDKAIKAAGLENDSTYPIELSVTEAKFVAEDGTETVFNDMMNITEMPRDAEGDIRFHIRPTDKVDKDTQEVLLTANPEVAGWDEEGAFNGGTLYFTIDFGAPDAAGDNKKVESKEDSKKESKAESKSSNTDSTSSASSAVSNTLNNSNTNTGSATGAVLGMMSVAAAGAIVAKKKH